jgi:hypothetical protein
VKNTSYSIRPNRRRVAEFIGKNRFLKGDREACFVLRASCFGNRGSGFGVRIFSFQSPIENRPSSNENVNYSLNRDRRAFRLRRTNHLRYDRARAVPWCVSWRSSCPNWGKAPIDKGPGVGTPGQSEFYLDLIRFNHYCPVI